MLIYNICPAPSPPGQPYKNWADGRCPFARETWEAVGFRVLAFDRDDSEVIRKFAHALGWDQGDSPIDLKADLFAQYSLMEKPAHPLKGSISSWRDPPGHDVPTGESVSAP